jgi:hypothetical protein
MNRRRLLIVLPLFAAAPARAAGGGSGIGGKPPPTFIRLPLVQANILRQNRTRGVISLENGVDVKDPKIRARIGQIQPRLRSDMARQLSLYTSNLAPGEAPDLDVLAPLLQKQVDLNVGGPGARLVLLNVLIN